MFTLRNLIKQITYRSLALAIIFCLSGMLNIICCVAKCEIAKSGFLPNQESLSCHQTQSSFEKSSCCSKEESDSSSNTCSKTPSNISSSEVDEDSNDKQTQILEYTKDASCRMSCCLPSEEPVDVTRTPKLDVTLIPNSLNLVALYNTAKTKIYLDLPIENLPDQEKSYLKHCVFLI
jgi:hypothetical protein